MVKVKEKWCVGCKTDYPITEFHYDGNYDDLLKPRCKHCIAAYNKISRQKRLMQRFNASDSKIARCACGDYFNITVGGGLSKIGKKDRCASCAKKQPLIKVYVVELKKTTWVRLPDNCTILPTVVGHFGNDKNQPQTFPRITRH